MLTHEPKIGDVVTLNSGGPDMTVTNLGNGRLAAAWVDTAGVYCVVVHPWECFKFVKPVYSGGSLTGGL
jgi:uncharacterized protein YodC (DUF2158 family)